MLPRGVERWEPDGCDYGDLDDLPVDEREESERAPGWPGTGVQNGGAV